jgi:uncharacterized protein (DUF1697 family)
MPRGKKARSSLKKYVALLRGINLGARNKVSMQDLRALFADLGAEDVATYVQSGNVVFRSADSPDSPGKLTDAIEKQIHRDLSLDVTVLVRTQRQLAKLVAANPFADDVSDPTKLHVTFLADKPDPARVRMLDPTLAEPDEFSVIGQEVYLHCPNGYGRSKLSNAYFEKLLDVRATTRNWRTVTKLAELAGA